MIVIPKMLVKRCFCMNLIHTGMKFMYFSSEKAPCYDNSEEMLWPKQTN